MSTAKFDTLSNLAGSLSVPVGTVVQGSAKAWVNFNGDGTVAIRAAFNVTSITDNGTGRYTLNFTNAMPDVNYAAVFNGNGNQDAFGGGGRQFAMVRTRATGTVELNAVDDGGAESDPSYIGAAIFR